MAQKKCVPITTKLVLLLVGVFVLLTVVVCENNQPSLQQTQRTSSPAPSSSAAASAPKIFPPLHIVTSGHLPTSVHGLRLGMAFSEAVKLDPRLQNFPGDASASLNSNDEAMVQERTREGIFLLATFTRGRAVNVEADVSDASPDDAENVDNATFGQLGAADIGIDERDRSYPLRRWVWVDGDVRIAYQDSTEANGARNLSLELIVFPVFLKGLEASGGPSDKTVKPLLVEQTKQEWGTERKPNPYASNPLPNGLEGLELHESPLQVSEVFPDADMNSTLDETYNGTYRLTNGNDVRFQFLDNKLKAICEDRLDVPPERFDEFRDALTARYGKTTTESLLGTKGWRNEKVNFYYLINKNESTPGKRPMMVVCVEDKQLMWAEKRKYASRPSYHAVPISHTFFVPVDLSRR